MAKTKKESRERNISLTFNKLDKQDKIGQVIVTSELKVGSD